MSLAPAPAEDADVETSSNAYARRFSGEVGTWFLSVQEQTTLALLRPRRGLRVIDVGGGHGQLLPALQAAGCEVTVLGSAPSCGSRLQPALAAGQGRFVVGDLRRGPWADQSFEAALCFRLLPHAHDWRGVINELCRVARETVIVDYPGRASVNAFAGALFDAKKRVEGDTRPFRVFADTEIDDAFGASGFRSSQRRGQFFWPMALHRALRRAWPARVIESIPRLLQLERRLGSPVVLRADRVKP